MHAECPYFYDKNLKEDVNKTVNRQIIQYAGIYLLKLMDSEESPFEVPLSSKNEWLETGFRQLAF